MYGGAGCTYPRRYCTRAFGARKVCDCTEKDDGLQSRRPVLAPIDTAPGFQNIQSEVRIVVPAVRR